MPTSTAATSCVTVETSRSPITLSVTLPAVRAVTATVMLSPGTYSGLSRAISSRSGVSALASAYQPASNPTGQRSAGIAGRHFEAVAAPLHRQRNARRLIGGHVDLSIGDALRRLHRLEVPDPLAAIPLVLGLDLEQLVTQAVSRQRCPVGRYEHDIEGRCLAFPERAAGEQRLDADHWPGRCHRQCQLAFNRAPAGLRHAHDDLRFERTRRLRPFFKLHGKACFAVVVRARQVFERLAGGRHTLVGKPKLVTGKAPPLARRRNDDLSFELEFGGRRPIEKTPIDGDLGSVRLGNARRVRGQLEFDPVGHVVLDQEGRLANRRAFWIGEGAYAPRASRGR